MRTHQHPAHHGKRHKRQACSKVMPASSKSTNRELNVADSRPDLLGKFQRNFINAVV